MALLVIKNWREGVTTSCRHKKPPEGGFTTLLIAFILFLSFPWYPERDLNPHSANAEGFKSLVSTDSTIRAREESGGAFRSRTGLDGFAIRYITALLTRQILQAFQPDIRLRPMSFKLERKRDSNSRPDLGKVVLYQLSYSRIHQAIS